MICAIRTCARSIPLFAAFAAMGLSGLVAAAAEGFAFKDTPGKSLDVLLDGRPVARYMYAHDAERAEDTCKPYLHVMDAEGNEPITKGLGGLYPHHRGIFIGYSRLSVDGKTLNNWGTTGGTQVHQEFTEQKASADQASFISLVHCNTKSGEGLLEEQRTFVFQRQPAPALIQIDVSSKLTAVAGVVQLGGDPEHAGLHYRPADELDRSQTRYLFPAEGIDPRKDKDLDWVGATYVLGGKTYSVVQMNHAGNPQGTIWSAYRDYGRFGAFAAAEIAEGDSLTLRYRFRVLAGELPPREQIQPWQDEYAKT